ncbi:MAG: hypothetical protein AAF968_03865 [Pseudomonadota bacterium]
MRSYETARSLYSFLGFCAWTLIVLGALAALIGMVATSQVSLSGAFLGALPGLCITVAGTMALAMVQNGRALVDTAEYTQNILQVSRDHLDASRQAMVGNTSAKHSYEALKAAIEANTAAARAVTTSYNDAAQVTVAKTEHGQPNGASTSASPALEARQEVPFSYGVQQREPVSS